MCYCNYSLGFVRLVKMKIIMVKQGMFKRVLLALLLLCSFLILYLYWYQDNRNTPRFNLYTTHMTPDPRWTWQCINQHCVRHLRENQEEPVSLTTCNMLCGTAQLWPQPTGPMVMGTRSVAFFLKQITFQTTAIEPAKTMLEQAFNNFNDSVIRTVRKSETWTQKSDLKQFLVKVSLSTSNEARLKLHTDESYNLTVRYSNENLIASVKAKNFFGARHGLETLSQLIWWDEFAQGGVLKILKAIKIQDAPIFPYRGLMVDTARNFMPLVHLKRAIEGMSACKLNVFHWHITDSQSFPLVSPRVPQLAKYGAYGPNMIYTAEDVIELVEFARIRGVRVILEIDTPAHAGNGWTWGSQEGLGELALCVNAQPWSLYCGEPPCGQLNPDNPHVYDILEMLYRDILDLSGENEIFHLGGDEVNLECWMQHLQRSVSPFNYTDMHDKWGEFTLKALKRLQIANKGVLPPVVILWSSNLSKRPYLAKYLNRSNVVVQSWGASQWPETSDLIADGYRVIISHVDAWYLDCGFGRWREIGEAACDPYRPWQTLYNHQPWGLDRKNIFGGEACLWSEQVDPGSLDTRLWPRAAAYAERVWSDPQVDLGLSTAESVYTRLSSHRDRLVSRGIGAEVMWPQWCSQNPGMCL